MLAFLKTAIPLFGRPSNYAEMLQKLAGFTFWECVILIYLLRRETKIAQFLDESFLNVIPKDVLPDNFAFLNIPTILISFLIAYIFFFFQMHNIIQRPFSIRKRFDTEKIFTPIMESLNIQISNDLRKKFQSSRSALMQKIFYKYASSTKQDTVVDKHNIHQALWLWSMFWAFEEAIFLLLIFSMIFSYFGMIQTLYVNVVIVLVLLGGMWQVWGRVSANARAQVEQICDNEVAAASISQVVRAL